jgi:hypothetical protein
MNQCAVLKVHIGNPQIDAIAILLWDYVKRDRSAPTADRLGGSGSRSRARMQIGRFFATAMVHSCSMTPERAA